MIGQTTRQDPALSRGTVGPVAPDSRIAEVDLVLGFALLTVPLENMCDFGADSIAWTSATDRLRKKGGAIVDEDVT